MKKAILIILLFEICISILAQKDDYKKAVKENTVEGFESFLSQYPDSKYVPEIRTLLIEKKWEIAVEQNTLEGFKTFVKNYPDSQFKEKAEEKIIDLKYNQVIQEDKIEIYKEFLVEYPSNKYTEIINDHIGKKMLIQKEYEEALKLNDIENYDNFLKKYPNNEYADSIKERMALILFPEIERGTDIEKYKMFVIQYPKTSLTTKAQSNLEKLEFQEASKSNSYKAYKQFTTNYPNSSLAPEADLNAEIMKIYSYYVNNENYSTYSASFRNKYPDLFKFYLDGLLYKEVSSKPYSYNAPKEPTEEEKQKAVEQARLVLKRPITGDNYDILNIIGIWMKEGSNKASARTFESAFSGAFFIRLIYSLIIAKEGENKDSYVRGNFFYCLENEYNSVDKDIIKFKNATLDMFEDNYNKYTKDPMKEFLEKIKLKETNSEILNRIDKILNLN
jgi:outer membrane protein assembly factor BamD (BamD/ComL family)